MKKLNLLEKAYLYILLAIFVLIVVHAPISVGFGTLFPDCELWIKSWKELLMLAAGVLLLAILYRKKKFILLKDPLILLILGYAVWHIVLVITFNQGLNATLAGLAIDLRYVFYFSLVYLALKMYPSLKNQFLNLGVLGAVVILGFAFLQATVLPNDVLKYIGYNQNTISPYLTVDQNQDFIRINSTLRGPNPLGAYAGAVIVLIVAFLLKTKVKDVKSQIKLALLMISGVVALWFSYSRSALLGTFVALVALMAIVRGKIYGLWLKSHKTLAFVSVAVMLGLTFGFVALNQNFVSNVLLHENPDGGIGINSNEDHASSLADGLSLALRNPFGAGIGSTGSASLYGASPLIIENQYLFTLHEVGFIGLMLFVVIFGYILKLLYQKKEDWLAVGLLTSGVGLALIGLVLPVWVDDTVAILWWALAAVALGGWGFGNGKWGKNSERVKGV